MIKLFPTHKTTYISSEKPSDNFGNQNQLYVSHLEDGFFGNESENRSLIYFDVNDVIEEIDFSEQNYKVELILNVSYSKLKGEDYQFFIHPLLKQFEEGFSTELYKSDGVSWYNASTGTPWDTNGGDYDDQILFPYTYDNRNNLLKIDITSYIIDINNGIYDNNGVIIIGSNHVNNIAFYSNSGHENLGPRVYLYKDVQILENNNVENKYDEGEFNTIPSIKILDHQSKVMEGELSQHVINVEPAFVRKSTWIPQKYRYSENLQFMIKDLTRNKTIVEYSDYTKVNVKNNIMINELDFSNFPQGLYEIKYRIQNDKYSDGVNILVEDKY